MDLLFQILYHKRLIRNIGYQFIYVSFLRLLYFRIYVNVYVFLC